MNETALLVVSFGTSYRETREKTIDRIEKELGEAFPDTDVRRAFTSGMIIKRLKERDRIYVNNVEEALHEIAADGYRKVMIQPTHIINGLEYEKMMRMIEPFRDVFDAVTVGSPLLTSSEDYSVAVEACAEAFGIEKGGSPFIFMGHGSDHHADAAYAALDYRFRAMGYTNVAVATVEGYPAFEDVADNAAAMAAEHGNRIALAPFMIVAGDHALNDMAGDDEDSWKSILESKGLEVDCILRGIGEFPQIRRIFAEHLKDAAEHQENCGA